VEDKFFSAKSLAKSKDHPQKSSVGAPRQCFQTVLAKQMVWTFPKKVDTVKSKPLISWPVRIGLGFYSPM